MKRMILVMALILGGCAKPANDERGYAFERFDTTGLKLQSCGTSKDTYGTVDTYRYSCSYVAPDGTEWSVRKSWAVRP